MLKHSFKSPGRSGLTLKENRQYYTKNYSKMATKISKFNTVDFLYWWLYWCLAELNIGTCTSMQYGW